MGENTQFSAIRERFETGSSKHQNVGFQSSISFFTKSPTAMSYTPTEFTGATKRIPTTMTKNEEMNSWSKTFSGNQTTENNGDELRSMTASGSAQHLHIVVPQTKQFTVRVKSFTELIQDKARTLRSKPVVPEKPKSKWVRFKSTKSSNQQLTNIPMSSPQYANSVKPKSKLLVDVKSGSLTLPFKEGPQQMPSAEEQKPLSVNKLRQQIEEKVAENQINLKSPGFENINALRPAALSPNIKTISYDISEERPYQKAWGTLQTPRRRGFAANDLQTNFKTSHFESRSLPRPGKQLQIKFNYSTSETPSEYKVFGYNPKECTPWAEANNLDIITSFTDEKVSSGGEADSDYNAESDDELRKCDQTLPDEPIHVNYNVSSYSMTMDLPRLPLQIPRQRASYAEPRSRPELKPSISFNQSDVKKKVDNREKMNKELQQITKELIKTENDYVQNLLKGIKNYQNLFTRKDRPRGLTGKEFHLFGNIEQIASFHHDILLPMLIRNQNDLKRLFDEFLFLLENHFMYDYVLYTINKRRSLEICENFAPYFTYLRLEFGDKLGIDDFLLQPIQRLPRYAMLFQNLIDSLFEGSYDKGTIASCCRLENKIGSLLKTANKANLISDIDGWSDLNVCNPRNKFREVLQLFVYDSDRSHGYSTKVFIFDKCMMYTEIRDNDLTFRGCYDASKEISLTLQKNAFTLSYLHPKMQECTFHGEPSHIQCCLRLINDIIQSNRKQVPNQMDYLQQQPAPPYRNSNHSNDSGLGNMWTLPEENESE